MPFFHKSPSNSPLQQKPPGSESTATLSESLAERRLTRQRKLRHLTDQDVGFESPEHPLSLPGSSDSLGKTKSPSSGSKRWSSSPLPQPLPPPELFLHRNSLSISRTSVQGHVGSPKEASKWTSSDHETQNLNKNLDSGQRRFANGLTLGVNGRNIEWSIPHRGPQSFSVIPNGEFYFGYLDNPLNKNCRGVPNHINVKSNSFHLMPKLSRSAPTSVLPSPAVSPGRPNAEDFLTSASNQPEYEDAHFSISSQAFPLKTAHSSQHSPHHSPTALSSFNDLRSPNDMLFPLPQKLQIDSSMDQSENHGHVNAHPLPLPPAPAASPQSLLSDVHHVFEKSHVSSMKGQWQKGKLIGRGTFGSVYLATNRETGALCAMKEVDLIPDDPKSAECIKQLEQEIKVLSQLKHPNIVQYYGSEVIDDHFYIYLEYVYPGSVNKYIREHCGAITESIIRCFTRHILSGLAYLHSTKTIHRDIKGANLLVDSSGVVKLADFGMAKHLTGQCDLSLKGSPYWMAPELIKAAMLKDRNPDLALGVDIWSLGCTIIEMMNGKPPWSEFEGHQAMFKVLNATPPIPEKLSLEGKKFLQCCFCRDPAERPSAVKLLDHPFLRSSNDFNVSVVSSTFSSMKLLKSLLRPKDHPDPKGDQVQNSSGTRGSNLTNYKPFISLRCPPTATVPVDASKIIPIPSANSRIGMA